LAREPPKNPAFHDACEALLQVGISQLRAACGNAQGEKIEVAEDIWLKLPGLSPSFAAQTTWVREQRRMTPQQKCVLDKLETLKHLPEYSRFAQMIGSDNLLSKQIGRNVGAAIMPGFVSVDDVVRRMFLSATEDGSTLEFSP
jgi:hypothetical protein